jgi:hypothetical protein
VLLQTKINAKKVTSKAFLDKTTPKREGE